MLAGQEIQPGTPSPLAVQESDKQEQRKINTWPTSGNEAKDKEMEQGRAGKGS
jgi:hypothetical protein